LSIEFFLGLLLFSGLVLANLAVPTGRHPSSVILNALVEYFLEERMVMLSYPPQESFGFSFVWFCLYIFTHLDLKNCSQKTSLVDFLCLLFFIFQNRLIYKCLDIYVSFAIDLYISGTIIIVMLSRSSTNQVVWKILRSDLAIQKDLQRNLINSRALAKYIISKYGLTASLDAVISSIRRFQGETHFKEIEKSLLNIFKKAVVSTKNNMACLTLNMRPAKFLKKIKMMENKASYRIITTPTEVKVMMEHPQLADVKKLFSKNEIAGVADKLSEIRVKVSETAVKTKGVLARIANELALADINLQEIIVCSPRFLIYVREKDIVKAHDAIMRLC